LAQGARATREEIPVHFVINAIAIRGALRAYARHKFKNEGQGELSARRAAGKRSAGRIFFMSAPRLAQPRALSY